MASIINATTSSGVAVSGDTSGVLQLATNGGTTAVTIDTSQNVGIGTTSPTAKFSIKNPNVSGAQTVMTVLGATSAVDLFAMTVNQTTDVVALGTNYAGSLAFNSNSTERMRITSAGNVGIGITAPTNKLYVSTNSTTATAKGLSIANTATSTANGAVEIDFYSDQYDGNTLTNKARITGSLDASNPALGYLAFSTNNSTMQERMRIDSSGNVLVGTASSINGNCAFQVLSSVSNQTAYLRNSNATPIGITMNYSAASPNNTGSSFIYCNDSTGERFSVRSNGGIYNYSANNSNLSDQREKKDIQLAGNYLDKICSIPVKTFLFNDQTDTDLNLGVIAQDVQAVAPELVAETNWAIDGEEPKMRLSIYQTDLQYALMKAIQEQQALITTLQTQVAALTAKVGN